MASEELCFNCGNPTGRAGASDDSIYWAETGPWCETCSDELRKEVEDDTGRIAELEDRVRIKSRTIAEQSDTIAELEREVVVSKDGYARALEREQSLERELGLREESRQRVEKVLRYVLFVLTGGEDVETDLCDAVQMAADDTKREVECLKLIYSKAKEYLWWDVSDCDDDVQEAHRELKQIIEEYEKHAAFEAKLEAARREKEA